MEISVDIFEGVILTVKGGQHDINEELTLGTITITIDNPDSNIIKVLISENMIIIHCKILSQQIIVIVDYDHKFNIINFNEQDEYTKSEIILIAFVDSKFILRPNIYSRNYVVYNIKGEILHINHSYMESIGVLNDNIYCVQDHKLAKLNIDEKGQFSYTKCDNPNFAVYDGYNHYVRDIQPNYDINFGDHVIYKVYNKFYYIGYDKFVLSQIVPGHKIGDEITNIMCVENRYICGRISDNGKKKCVVYDAISDTISDTIQIFHELVENTYFCSKYHSIACGLAFAD